MKIVQSRIGRKYGWKRGLPNFKLKKYRDVCPGEVVSVTQLPPSVDLRPKCLPVYDQGSLGSCSANAIAGAIEFLQPGFMPSRLFIYWNERDIEGSTSNDSGAQLTDGIASILTTGVCSEAEWPYDISKFTVKPVNQCYVDAKKNVLSQYLNINGLQEIKSCLYQGYPFVFGFSVYQSFESDQVAQTGIVPMPLRSEECLGGHAVLCCGYDDKMGCAIVKNSWGSGWGDNGFFYMPYQYISNQDMASELLTVRK